MKHFIIGILLLSLSRAHAQHQDKVDFLHAQVDLLIVPENKEILGKTQYRFKILDRVDSIFLDAKNLDFDKVTLNAKRIRYEADEKKLILYKKFKKGSFHQLLLEYRASPKQTVYSLGFKDTVMGNEQVWTQGQGKYTSHWLPSFDDMEEKIEFDLGITFDRDYQVVANGKLTSKSTKDGKTTWQYDMQESMSSYLLAFAIGRYQKQELTSSSGVPIENYYYPSDSAKVEPTYRYTRNIFDFFEAEIGVPYPWQNYKQLPVRDFLYAGMENTGTTIFSDGFMVDSIAFVDKNYVNVNAHELAHQWFGNLVTEKDGSHHWLHEGFATFYAYLAEKDIYGADHFYWKLFRSLQEIQEQIDSGGGQSLLDPKASSLTFYEKGAWALFALRNLIGVTPFRRGIQNYLTHFKFDNATIHDFIKEMEEASGSDLSDFREKWLISKSLPLEEARLQLAGFSPSIDLLFTMEEALPSKEGDTLDYQKYWKLSKSIHFKRYVLQKYIHLLPEEILRDAFQTDTVPIRQALLTSPSVTTLLSKEEMESFLDDRSYVTREMALFTLWQRYATPGDRTNYLDRTKDQMGLPSLNLRLLWLTLAVLTEGYGNPSEKQGFLDELLGYTAPSNSFEIRQGAFFYVNEVFGWRDRNLTDLLNATSHHSWQFRKFARNLLDELLKEETMKERILGLAKTMGDWERQYLESKLN